MAKTYKRICIQNYEASDGENTMTLHRGDEYVTSSIRNGNVQVYSTFWAWVPAYIFAGEVVFTDNRPGLEQRLAQYVDKLERHAHNMPDVERATRLMIARKLREILDG